MWHLSRQTICHQQYSPGGANVAACILMHIHQPDLPNTLNTNSRSLCGSFCRKMGVSRLSGSAMYSSDGDDYCVTLLSFTIMNACTASHSGCYANDAQVSQARRQGGALGAYAHPQISEM